jgi:hypothetical protein
VELASQLADKEVNYHFKYSSIEVYEEDEDNGGTKYSQEAQGIFDMFYDKYYSMIEQTKVKP